MIVEDDRIICKVLKEILEKWQLKVVFVSDFNCVDQFFLMMKPHIVLMDISLPFYNGFHWTNQIRKVSKVPIIFISSKDTKMDMLLAMNMGADDYIVKPFDVEIVVAKIQALLRRSYRFIKEVDNLQHQGLVLHNGSATAYYHNKPIDLTKNEYQILHILLENKGNSVTREKIMQRLWDDESFIDDNTLTVNMTRLRKKLASVGLDDFIRTKKGVGYIIYDERFYSI